MDKYMAKLVSLGILSKNNTTHTSPVMLVARKGSKNKRPVVDFRLLNTRIMRRNTATPLLRDIFKMLGRSKCEVLSCVDLKDAFHSLGLTDKAKEFCIILPYFGSAHYRYEVLPMGLSISQQVWITYIENLLEGISNRNSYIAIMDDLMIYGLRDGHLKLFKNLLISLIDHGLKLSPRKCQLFMKHLLYLGNVFHIEDGVITITPMKSRIEAIQKLEHPTTVKGCKSFCGVVNYLSLFCRDLQKILKPIYELTRKEHPFVWTAIHQKAFEQVKELLVKPPVLHLPRPGGRFILYCDTSKTHTGSSLWQMQGGRPRLLGYASKSLPNACQNYSVTKLEMTGLVINIHLWKHLLLRVEFDCAVDHRALPYIMKSKNLPATGRIIRLLEHLSSYSFNLYYVKGKDMTLCDYLSRIVVDDGNPDEVIPISFNAVAQYRLAMDYVTEFFMITHFNVATRSSTSAAGVNLPPVHGAHKGLDPDLKPENQEKSKKVLLKFTIITPVKSPAATPGKSIRPTVNTPTIARTPTLPGNSPRSLINTPWINKTPTTKKTPLSLTKPAQTQNQQTPNRPLTIVKTPISPAQAAGRKLIQRSVRLLNTPPHKTPIKLPSDTQTPVAWPQSQLPPLDIPSQELDVPIPKINPPMQPLPPQQCLLPQNNPFDIGSDLIPFQDREVKAVFKSPEMEDFLLPPTLGDQISDNTLLHRHLPRQSDIDRIMAQIRRKYLTKLQLPCSIRDMQSAYLNSPHFRDIYLALSMNKMPSKARTAKKLELDILHAVYMIHGGLLYRYMKTTTGDSEPVLCVPTYKVDIFLELFHSSILGGHMGMSKSVLTLQQKFYCPNLAYHVRMYIISCHVCQTFKRHKRFDRPLNRRIIDINAPTLTHISMDTKHMPPSKDKFLYILVLLCEVSNFIVAAPMKTVTAPEICNAIMNHFIGYFGTPIRIVCDQDPAFMSHLCQWFLHSYGIHITTASPTNHQSLMAEHGIKSLSNILMKHLTGLGEDWPLYCKPTMLVYNSYATPNLDHLSPFEVAIGRKAILAPKFEYKPKIPITGTYVKAKEKLEERLEYFKKRLEDFRSNRNAVINKDRQHQGYMVGQIVYMYNPSGSQLQTGSRKIQCHFVSPLAIYKCISPNQFLLMSLDGVLYPVIVEEARLKPGLVATHKGPARNMSELKRAAQMTYANNPMFQCIKT